MPYEIIDPHFLPGSISGLGIEHDPNRGRVVNTQYGVRLDHTDGCLIEYPIPGRVTVAFNLAGMVDGTADRATALFLFSPDGAAQIISKLAAILVRYDPGLIAHLGGQLQEMARPIPEAVPERPVEPESEPEPERQPESEPEVEAEATNPALPYLATNDRLVATGRLGANSHGGGDTGADTTMAA